MGHPQPSTPIQVDNTTAVGFANSTIKQKRSKAIDMRFYWIQDRTRQGQFLVYWGPGTANIADYHTKHHSPTHHRLMRNTFLHPPAKLQPTTEQLANTLLSCLMRGCANSTPNARARQPAVTRGTTIHRPAHYITCGTLIHKPATNRYQTHFEQQQTRAH
jgi:hypothetical protein